MAIPIFYTTSYDPGSPDIELNEANSRHVVQVLRMQPGEDLRLTDGKGSLITATITAARKHQCRVRVKSLDSVPAPERKVSIAISPLKNVSRFEWFLEKATEIGVLEIIPLHCDRSERQQVRTDRLENILVSAMLQSQQAWLPVLRPLTPFSQVSAGTGFERRLIAWLGGGGPRPLPVSDLGTTVILIGPEGDFTPDETAAAVKNGFVPVCLGKNRLRTETAGVVAAALLCIR